uniref:Uncharacterized protein n=1 Tax=Romanomermis culicivorax TaxID=13658 RepID=A0A915KVB5_ROMCU
MKKWNMQSFTILIQLVCFGKFKSQNLAHRATALVIMECDKGHVGDRSTDYTALMKY